MKQSKELTEFYKAYRIWLLVGAPDMCPFDRKHGLCFNIRYYYGWELWDNILEEIQNQFEAEGLNVSYPFGIVEYMQRGARHTMHLDVARFKWVKDHLTHEHIGEQND